MQTCHAVTSRGEGWCLNEQFQNETRDRNVPHETIVRSSHLAWLRFPPRFFFSLFSFYFVSRLVLRCLSLLSPVARVSYQRKGRKRAVFTPNVRLRGSRRVEATSFRSISNRNPLFLGPLKLHQSFDENSVSYLMFHECLVEMVFRVSYKKHELSTKSSRSETLMHTNLCEFRFLVR